MAAGCGLACDDDMRRAVHDAYVDYLVEEVATESPDSVMLPGVRALLDTLSSRDDVHLALLTGNFRRGAEIKLGHVDLWRYFPAGAFGDDSHDRNALLWKALANVEASGGPSVRPADAVIIGDTPLDVAVAVKGGARSLAVATGSYDVDTLLESGADRALANLAEQAAVLEALNLK